MDPRDHFYGGPYSIWMYSDFGCDGSCQLWSACRPKLETNQVVPPIGISMTMTFGCWCWTKSDLKYFVRTTYPDILAYLCFNFWKRHCVVFIQYPLTVPKIVWLLQNIPELGQGYFTERTTQSQTLCCVCPLAWEAQTVSQ